LSYTRPRILPFKNVQLLSMFVSVEVSDAYVNVLSIIVFFSINFSFVIYNKSNLSSKRLTCSSLWGLCPTWL
jgi:hypothetical protein